MHFADFAHGVELGCMITVLLDQTHAKKIMAVCIVLRLVTIAINLTNSTPPLDCHNTDTLHFKNAHGAQDQSPVSVTTQLLTSPNQQNVAAGWDASDRANQQDDADSVVLSSCPSSPLLTIEEAHKQRATSTWAPPPPPADTFPIFTRVKRSRVRAYSFGNTI